MTSEEFFGEESDDSDRRVPDISKAKRVLGWEPKWGLDDLITATMDSYVADFRNAAASEASDASDAVEAVARVRPH